MPPGGQAIDAGHGAAPTPPGTPACHAAGAPRASPVRPRPPRRSRPGSGPSRTWPAPRALAPLRAPAPSPGRGRFRGRRPRACPVAACRDPCHACHASGGTGRAPPGRFWGIMGPGAAAPACTGPGRRHPERPAGVPSGARGIPGGLPAPLAGRPRGAMGSCGGPAGGGTGIAREAGAAAPGSRGRRARRHRGGGRGPRGGLPRWRPAGVRRIAPGPAAAGSDTRRYPRDCTSVHGRPQDGGPGRPQGAGPRRERGGRVRTPGTGRELPCPAIRRERDPPGDRGRACCVAGVFSYAAAGGRLDPGCGSCRIYHQISRRSRGG